MTAVPDSHEFTGGVSANDQMIPVKPYEIEEAYWGYVIHSRQRVPATFILAQMVSWGVGIVFAVIAIGMWILPAAITGDDLLAFKLGATVPIASVSALFLWFASRGSKIEIQIDTNRGEVREVLRNRAGRSTLLGLYGFDSIGGVFMERENRQPADKPGEAQLVLRYRNTAQVLRVAHGPEVMLEALRDRLGRDLMVRRGRVARIVAEAMSVA